MKFSAVLLFAVLWFTFAYLPIAHMVWFWPGPDAYHRRERCGRRESAKAGWLWQKGALDFAGGTVVHINAGVAGLVGAYVIGKRIGYGKEAMAPHNLTFTMIGASLLWVGWFGFNAGSALEAGDVAALAFINTLARHRRRGAGVDGRRVDDQGQAVDARRRVRRGRRASSRSRRPAASSASTGAIVIGLARRLRLPVGRQRASSGCSAPTTRSTCSACTRVGGILGALLTGVFAAPSLGGQGIYDYVADKISADYSIGGQVWIQAKGVRHDDRLVRRRRVHRVQDRRPGGRPARHRGRGARRPRHQLARRVGVPDVGAAARRSPQWLFGAPSGAPFFSWYDADADDHRPRPAAGAAELDPRRRAGGRRGVGIDRALPRLRFGGRPRAALGCATSRWARR